MQKVFVIVYDCVYGKTVDVLTGFFLSMHKRIPNDTGGRFIIKELLI